MPLFCQSRATVPAHFHRYHELLWYWDCIVILLSWFIEKLHCVALCDCDVRNIIYYNGNHTILSHPFNDKDGHLVAFYKLNHSDYLLWQESYWYKKPQQTTLSVGADRTFNIAMWALSVVNNYVFKECISFKKRKKDHFTKPYFT